MGWDQLEGYRLAAVVALSRVLGEQSERSVRVPSRQRVELLDAAGAVAARIHVARTPLVELDASLCEFLGEAANASHETVVVSATPIATAITRAWAGDAEAVRQLASASEAAGLPTATLRAALTRTALVPLELESLERSLHQALAGLAPGSDGPALYNLLLASIARAGGARLSRTALLEKIRVNARFLGARPQIIQAFGLVDREPLPASNGASFSLDSEVAAAATVVVHGHPDTGKRAAAGGWLRARVPQPLCFTATACNEYVGGALAETLQNYAQALSLDLVVEVAASERFVGWPTFVRDLSGRPGVRVIVTADTAEWRRATVRGVCFAYAEKPYEAPVGAPGPDRELGATALARVNDDALERFLLDALLAADTPALRAATTALRPRTWTGVGAVVRALVWAAARDEVVHNAQVIGDAVERFGNAWFLILDTDVAGVGGRHDDAVGLSPATLQVVASLRARQRARGADAPMFAALRHYLGEFTGDVGAPQTARDWACLAEVQFWRRHLGIAGGGLAVDGERMLALAAAEQPVPVLAALGLGFDLGVAPEVLAARLAADAHGLSVSAQAGAIEAAFAYERPGDALTALWLLRGLAPKQSTYAVSLFGSPSELPVQTQLQVPARALPPPWLTDLNARFVHLVDHRYRPPSWGDYARSVNTLRRAALGRLDELVHALDVYFRKKTGTELPGDLIDVDAWELSFVAMTRPPRCPQTAVDPWGFAAENERGVDPQRELALLPTAAVALESLRKHLDAQAEYWSTLANFFRVALGAMTLQSMAKGHSAEVRADARKIAEDGGLDAKSVAESLGAITAALKALPRFQREFRQHFAGEGDLDLEVLEQREHDVLLSAVALWQRLASSPGDLVAEAAEISRTRLADALSDVRAALRRPLLALASEGIEARVLSGELSWSGEPALWVVFDVKSPTKLYAAHIAVDRVLREALSDISKNDLRRVALELWAQHLVIVGLIGGRALARDARVLTTLTPGDVGQLWLQTLRQPARDDEWDRASLPVWQAPALAVPEQLQRTAQKLYEALAQLGDFDRLPNTAMRRTPVVRAHTGRLGDRVAALVHSLTTQVRDALLVLADLPAAERQNHLALVAASERLADFYQKTIFAQVPRDGHEPTLGEVGKWAQTLRAALSDLEIFRLLWAADVLGLAL